MDEESNREESTSREGGTHAALVKPSKWRHDVSGHDLFTDCVLLFFFFALLGSVVFSRGSKKVLFWRSVQEQ